MGRIIKLSTQYRPQMGGRYYKKVPSLRIYGNWLQEAGFEPAKLVRVEVRDNQLVITSIE